MNPQQHNFGCPVALDLLAANDFAAWAEHAATCPACREGQRHLARAIMHGGEDAIPCAECRAQLPHYMEEQLGGVDVVKTYPQVAQHLDSCSACAAAGADLRDVLMLEQEGQLVEPSTWPTFDLSFLPPVERPSLPSVEEPPIIRDPWHARLGSRTRTGLDEAGWRVVAIHIFARPALPEPAVAVRNGRASPENERLILAEVVDVGQLDLGIEVTMARAGEDADVGQVRVVVDSPRLPQGPAGTRVTIACQDMSRTQVVDDLGVGLFNEVPLICLEDMQIEVVLPEPPV